jgi:alanine-synthesizing transaminase
MDDGGDFLDLLERAIKNMTPKPVAVIVNYPGNPTSEVVDLAFYEKLVALCKQYGVYIISDLAYCELYYDGNPPPSVLQVAGAKDIAIEFTSLSKTYSMAGWRVGFAAGNKKLIHALTRIKSYLDYGMFTPAQVAATAAINGSQDYVDEMRTLYKERRDIVVKGLNDAGWPVPSPSASMFIWAPLPDQYKELGSFEFAKLLLDQAEVAVAPGVGFGEYGDSHVRIALVENKHRLRQAVRNIKAFMAKDAEKIKSALKAAA